MVSRARPRERAAVMNGRVSGAGTPSQEFPPKVISENSIGHQRRAIKLYNPMCLQLDLNYDGLRRLFQEKKGLDLIDGCQTVQLLDPARAWA